MLTNKTKQKAFILLKIKIVGQYVNATVEHYNNVFVHKVENLRTVNFLSKCTRLHQIAPQISKPDFHPWGGGHCFIDWRLLANGKHHCLTYDNNTKCFYIPKMQRLSCKDCIRSQAIEQVCTVSLWGGGGASLKKKNFPGVSWRKLRSIVREQITATVPRAHNMTCLLAVCECTDDDGAARSLVYFTWRCTAFHSKSMLFAGALQTHVHVDTVKTLVRFIFDTGLNRLREAKTNSQYEA